MAVHQTRPEHRSTPTKANGVDALEPKLRRRVRELLHRDVARVEYPGGKSRESIRLVLNDGRSVIATTRSSLERAVLEKRILQALGKRNACAPRLLASKRHLLFQQDVGGERLAQALSTADREAARMLLDSALEGLAGAHRAASAAGLDDAVPARGHEEAWIVDLLRQPRRIGEHLSVDAPRLHRQPLVDMLSVRKARFVKWDARPGNAVVNDAGHVTWIDWEHAGSRNRLDDLAWLLADEYVSDDADTEASLIDTHLAAFADGLDDEQAKDYLFTYGTFHSCVRLGYILKYFLRENEWWSLERCLRKDKIGVTLSCAQTVCRRASRWASRSSLAAELAPWFQAVDGKLGEL